jgi:hypothetical protein
MGFGDSIIYTPSFLKKSKQESGKLTFLLCIGMLIVFSGVIVPMDPIALLQVRPELCDMIVVVLGFGGCFGSVLYLKNKVLFVVGASICAPFKSNGTSLIHVNSGGVSAMWLGDCRLESYASHLPTSAEFIAAF